MANQKNGQKNRLWDFEPAGRIEWEEQIKDDLKGADYKAKLYWNPLEGFTAAPFYIKEDLQNLKHDVEQPIPDTTGWTCCEPVYDTTPVKANKTIKKALHKGSGSFFIRSESTWKSGNLGGDMFGTQIQKQVDFCRLMDSVDTDSAEFIFDSGMTTPALVAMMKNHPNFFSNPHFIFDPFSYVAKRGRLPIEENQLKQIVSELAGQKNMKTLCANGLFYHQAGASIVQELGLALATASEFLAMTEADKKERAANAIFVRLSAGPLYFPEIAKFRAIRLLWKNLMNAYGVENPPALCIFAETSENNKTITDSHNNLIRTITESMAAVLGGANRLLVHPYDSLQSTPGEFSRRIARNVQYILRHEAHLDKVADPSAGSYYIENLTAKIAEKSWEYFQTVEKEGGILQSIKNGSVQEVINRAERKKTEALEHGKKILVGTSYYANSEEELPEIITPPSFADSLELTEYEFEIPDKNIIHSLRHAFKEEATVGDVIHSILRPEKVLFQIVETSRAGSVFDEIRLRFGSLSKDTGFTPAVHLVPAGDKKWRHARATFSHNVMACGGFRIDHPPGFDSVEEAAGNIESGPADLFVLCSSDQEYEDLVKPFCEAFSDKGICILAGHPGDHEEKYRDAGIDFFIHKEMNIPAVLLDIQNNVFKRGDKHATA